MLDDVDNLDAVLRTLGIHLAALRKRQVLSLNQAAARMRERHGVAITGAALGMYETSRRSISTRRLLQLAKLYDVSAAWLLAQAVRCTGTDPTCPFCAGQS